MNQHEKKGISLILAIVMVVGLLPAAVFATEAEQVYISASHDGQFISDQNGDVLIPLFLWRNWPPSIWQNTA